MSGWDDWTGGIVDPAIRWKASTRIFRRQYAYAGMRPLMPTIY